MQLSSVSMVAVGGLHWAHDGLHAAMCRTAANLPAGNAEAAGHLEPRRCRCQPPHPRRPTCLAIM